MPIEDRLDNNCRVYDAAIPGTQAGAWGLVFTHMSSAEEVDNSTAIYGRFPP